jgi:hypothetical protein
MTACRYTDFVPGQISPTISPDMTAKDLVVKGISTTVSVIYTAIIFLLKYFGLAE